MKAERKFPHLVPSVQNLEETLHRQRVINESILRAQNDLSEGCLIMENLEVIYVSDAVCRALGYTFEEFKAMKSFESLLNPDDKKVLTDRFQRRIKGEPVPEHYETSAIHKSGKKVYVEVSIKLNRQLNLLIVLIRDITLHKTLEEERDRFVSTLTHDLRIPLTAAKMGAELLEKDPTLSEQSSMLCNRISYNLDRVEFMIRDLLDANSIRAGQRILLKMEEINLNEFIQNTLNELADIHGNRFVFKSDHPLKVIWCRSGFKRILENLLVNAVKYGDAAKPIKVNAQPENGHVCISIHNEGNPIPPADQEALFKPFHRTHQAMSGGKKGWGIGLTLVQGMVAAHGGHVKVESSAEKGTTFSIHLPQDSRQFGK
jgi:PAS domain S-box-containing protein